MKKVNEKRHKKLVDQEDGFSADGGACEGSGSLNESSGHADDGEFKLKTAKTTAAAKSTVQKLLRDAFTEGSTDEII